MPGSLSRRRSGRRSTLAPPIAVTGRAIETRWHGCTFPAHADRELRLRFLRRYRRAIPRLATGPPGPFGYRRTRHCRAGPTRNVVSPRFAAAGTTLGRTYLGPGSAGGRLRALLDARAYPPSRPTTAKVTDAFTVRPNHASGVSDSSSSPFCGCAGVGVTESRPMTSLPITASMRSRIALVHAAKKASKPSMPVALGSTRCDCRIWSIRSSTAATLA
jgi:hypothetical protein